MAYTPTNWQTGDTITAEKLNKMEGGIESANVPFVVTLTPTGADLSGTTDKTVAEITAAYQAGRKIVYKVAMSETQFIYADVTMVYIESDYTYPSFGAYVIDVGNNLLIDAFTGTTDTGTKHAYSTEIYPLTPMP